jgi:hypothetical protein
MVDGPAPSESEEFSSESAPPPVIVSESADCTPTRLMALEVSIVTTSSDVGTASLLQLFTLVPTAVP